MENRHKPKQSDQNTKNTTKQSISRVKSNRLSDNKISPTTSGALQDTSIPTTSTGHPEDIIRNTDNKHGKKHKKKSKHKLREKPEHCNDMGDAKVKKHKKKRRKSDTVFDGDTGRKFPEKPEHSKDMRGEKVKKHKKKRTKSDKILDGDSGRVIVIIAPPSKAVKILKSEQKHNFWKHVQRRRRIRPE